MLQIPTIDLTELRAADSAQRTEMFQDIDSSLRRTGMFLLRGHGVPADLAEEMRACGRKFFGLPADQKVKYAVQGRYDNGWTGPGLITAAAIEGEDSTPDLHEAFHMGPTRRTGNAEFDALYYPENRWPAEVPELRAASERYTEHMVRVSLEVLEMLALILGIPEDFFVSRAKRATWTQNVNWYPPLTSVGAVQPGQMRVGPHFDFGSLSLLDRQFGVGGLEVWSKDEGWGIPPYDPTSLAVILGDLMNRWTDGRWRAMRHRVLPPDPEAPNEELFSLVFFFEADPDAVITPLEPPVGGGEGKEPVVVGESILRNLGVITAPILDPRSPLSLGVDR
jgi:isopenicillin N synthase-like dioxygenase